MGSRCHQNIAWWARAIRKIIIMVMMVWGSQQRPVSFSLDNSKITLMYFCSFMISFMFFTLNFYLHLTYSYFSFKMLKWHGLYLLVHQLHFKMSSECYTISSCLNFSDAFFILIPSRGIIGSMSQFGMLVIVYADS